MNPNIPVNPEQRWEWIKFQLRIAGSNLSQLASELDVSDSAVQLAKYSPYPRMERAIARRLKLQPAQLWPERWNADGTPSRQRPNRAEKRKSTHSAKRKSAQSQKRVAVQDSVSNAIAHRQPAVEV